MPRRSQTPLPRRRPGRPVKHAAVGVPVNERMLAVATQLFALKGYKAVSIREIAQRSGVTLSSLYHHFGDKRSLYIQAHLQEFKKSSARLEAAIEKGDTPALRLLSFTSELCRVLSEPGPLFRLVARHWIEGDPDVVRSLARATVPEQFRRTRAAIRALAPGRNPTAVTLSVYALVHGHITLRSFSDSITSQSGVSRVPELMAEFVLTQLLPEIDWRSLRKSPRRLSAAVGGADAAGTDG